MVSQENSVGFRWDWKFIVGSLLTIGGLAIPVYLWQVDLSSHSLSLKLVSSSALQPASSNQFQDLQITLNGARISSPYISSFEMINTGSKPILSSDFESPIEVLGDGNVQLISAQVTGTDPKGIPVKLSIESNRMVIAPFLSNPNDVISFSVITGDEPPIFKVKARIAGIRELALEDSSVKKGRASKLVICSFFAIIGLFLYLRFAHAAVLLRRVTIHRPTCVMICLMTGVGSAIFTGKALDELSLFYGISIDPKLELPVLAVLFFMIWIPYVRWWTRERNRQTDRHLL
ncbi:hypothetical protein [Pseudomonas sp. B21-019]|uniref:hypothetical protein n=1 Tax=Pseudomonas sp. B21-019 TaxID=2895475 RepID=UPI0021607DB1|nr:hypothetical protein [Pseudomonas sp. B21-019]UVM33414.1 hypothetical protein LOY36_01425 [Pseudomonas sp. B21-019]